VSGPPLGRGVASGTLRAHSEPLTVAGWCAAPGDWSPARSALPMVGKLSRERDEGSARASPGSRRARSNVGGRSLVLRCRLPLVRRLTNALVLVSTRQWTAPKTRRQQSVSGIHTISLVTLQDALETFDGIAKRHGANSRQAVHAEARLSNAVLRDAGRIPELLILTRVKYDSDEDWAVHTRLARRRRSVTVWLGEGNRPTNRLSSSFCRSKSRSPKLSCTRPSGRTQG
jgi:hypothetical protein